MKRSSFLKLIGLAFAAPAAVVKAVEPSQDKPQVGRVDQKYLNAITLLDRRDTPTVPLPDIHAMDLVWCQDKKKVGYVLRVDGRFKLYVADPKTMERWETENYKPMSYVGRE